MSPAGFGGQRKIRLISGSLKLQIADS